MDVNRVDRLARFLSTLPNRRLSRRGALRAGSIGLGSAALGTAGLGIAGLRAAQQATPTAESTAEMSGMTVAAATPAAPPAAPPLSLSETWTEPWIWRPSDWPGQQLNLNVVENENPGSIVGYGNASAVLFSYNGGTPGPTIRMRGDEVLLVRLRNLLGRNEGSTDFGPYPDPNELPTYLSLDEVNKKAAALDNVRQDFCLGEHANGVHTARDTNLHSHGVHVRPGRNPDGTHSDNIMLRLIGRKDLAIREAEADTPTCRWLHEPDQTSFLREDETVGFADFEFHVGDVQASAREKAGLAPQPHPPGTHWYHPHCHGSTHNQVASGMAGFLLIEGDVDDAINRALTGVRDPDPQLKTGTYDYIERTMLIQRVFLISKDPDAPTKSLLSGMGSGGTSADIAVNGDNIPDTIAMRPGAIERWRVLNGSVDGQGYMRFMVLKGQYKVRNTMGPNGNIISTLVKLRDAATNTFTPATRAEVAADKQHLYQLAFDGVTLVEADGDKAVYAIRDLAEQNAGTENPLDRPLAGNPNQAMLANYEAAFANATNVKNAFVRPNEVVLGQGNRTDVFFQAPRAEPAGGPGAKADVYTVLARASILELDDYQRALQTAYTNAALTPPPIDIVVAYVVAAEGDAADGTSLPPIPAYDVMDLNKALPPVPDYLLPVADADLRIKTGTGSAAGDADAAIAGRTGKYRTRSIAYSGWGANGNPLVTTEGDSETAKNFRAFVARDQATGGKLESLRYAKISGTEEYLLLPPMTRSMGISASTSSRVVDASDPLFPITADMARKFMPDDPLRPRMLVNTAEEWAVYNYSISLWVDTAVKPTGQYTTHYPGIPLLRADGQARFAAQPADGKTFLLQTRAADHPFHIHQNPYWVTRIEVPDEHGNLVNILDKPRWQDVVLVPRNGGRVVFRSRFPDYVGTFVNHCHILMHEDNGMMQAVEVTPFADQANYELKERVASGTDSADAVSAIYPPLDQAGAWRQCLQFVDPTPSTGQVYPGFRLGPPPQ